jgi:hypothetical protein
MVRKIEENVIQRNFFEKHNAYIVTVRKTEENVIERIFLRNTVPVL